MPLEQPTATIDQDKEVFTKDMADFSYDPYNWVLYSFDWGQGDLKGFEGPDEWQTKILKEITELLQKGIIEPENAVRIILEAVASGHGIGKSALVAWVILWSLSTFEDTKGIVTANTETQLKTKTWAELAKWHRLFICKDMFKFTATAIFSTVPEHEKTWRFDMVAWSENKTEAFAGMHNLGKRIVIIFDEASAIPDKIWEVTEGALTDENTEIFWFAFGNPTRGTGRFFDCFHKLRHRWFNRQIDSRTAKISNKTQIQKWIEDYGINSDFVKVRVLGQFPAQSDRQFIPADVAAIGRGKHLREDQYNFAAKILVLDNAWTGGDKIVIGLRQGLAYKRLMKLDRNDNDLEIAGFLAKAEDEHQADAVFIDLGYGTGVFSAGKTMNRKWQLIAFGGASPDTGYLNLRAYMWAQMKQWLRDGGAYPDDQAIYDDLVGPEYGVVATGSNAGKTFLESKEDMKSRGLPSPNDADAIAISFAFPVQPKPKNYGQPNKPNECNSKYDVLA